MAGLEVPTTGRIIIGGEDMTAVPPQHRDVAMVFQSYALYPHMTVRQNWRSGYACAAWTQPMSRRAVEKTAGHAGHRARCSTAGRRSCREDSASAWLSDARSLDTPARTCSTSRSRTSIRCCVSIRAPSSRCFIGSSASTMVYVTHDQEEAMTLGSRIAVMRDGMVEQVGPPLDVYRHPANRFVASFIGTPRVNLFACSCERLADGWSLASSVFINPLTLPGFDGQLPRQIEAGFRPQDAELCAAQDAHVVGTTVLIEPLGPATLLHVRVDGTSEGSLRVVVPADTPARHGEQVWLRIRLDRLHFFDISNGGRLAGTSATGRGTG